jgi:hypothetical protein
MGEAKLTFKYVENYLINAIGNAKKIERLVPDPDPEIRSICPAIDRLIQEAKQIFPRELSPEERIQKEVNERVWEIIGDLTRARELLTWALKILEYEMGDVDADEQDHV